MGEVKNSLLMLIATLGVLILLGFLMFVNVPKDNAQILLAIVGPLLGFYFGSSVNKQPVPTASVTTTTATTGPVLQDTPPTPPVTMSDVINQSIIDATKP